MQAPIELSLDWKSVSTRRPQHQLRASYDSAAGLSKLASPVALVFVQQFHIALPATRATVIDGCHKFARGLYR